jgi:hypothetical protein
MSNPVATNVNCSVDVEITKADLVEIANTPIGRGGVPYSKYRTAFLIGDI